MRTLPPEAAAQFGVFTATQAADAGWTRGAVRAALHAGRLVRIRRGVYAEAVDLQPQQALRRRAVATGLSAGAVTLSHAAAAAIDGLPLLRVPDLVCITTARDRVGDVPGTHRHLGRLAARERVVRHGVGVTATARTVVDLGREFGTDQAIVAADAALRIARVTRPELSAALDRCAGWPGVTRSALAVELADPLAESPLESLSRLRMHQFGLVAPALQTRIVDRFGSFLGRTDFYWDEFGVIGEADGLSKYDDPAELHREKIRQEFLEQAGLIAVRWTWRDLRRFEVVAHRPSAAFARGARIDRAPRLWTPLPSAA